MPHVNTNKDTNRGEEKTPRARHGAIFVFKPPLTGADAPGPPQTSWLTIRITRTLWLESLKFLTNLK